ncbi:hypothetical protein LV178_03430, partial [Burkholderia mallei]|nr:hypothetical protein [Burkholderia mallei]
MSPARAAASRDDMKKRRLVAGVVFCLARLRMARVSRPSCIAFASFACAARPARLTCTLEPEDARPCSPRQAASRIPRLPPASPGGSSASR